MPWILPRLIDHILETVDGCIDVTGRLLSTSLPSTQLIHRNRGIVNDLNIGISRRASMVLTFTLLGVLLHSPWQPLFLIGAVALYSQCPAVPVFGGRSEGFDLQFQPFHGTGSIFCIVGVAFAVGMVATSLSGDVSKGQTIGRDGLNRYDTQNHSRSTGAYTCGNILGNGTMSSRSTPRRNITRNNG